MKTQLSGLIVVLSLLLTFNGCKEMKKESAFKGEKGEVKLITLDPGHFHAHLVQKSMYDQVDQTVHVYAPKGRELEDHLSKINEYNNRQDDPTAWETIVYEGDDYLEKMIRDKKGNVVVMAGNNGKKTEYIKAAIVAGFNVLSDKPMAINEKNFELLKEAFASAEKNNVLLYDIMTERYEITSMLQKEFSLLYKVFGVLEKGSVEDPAVVKESVHHFYKHVSGSILRRPPWFFDVEQQGEGIVDVTTHLVDLIQWACFPGEIIDYTKDITMISAKHWPTLMTVSQFKDVTREAEIPGYLMKDLKEDTTLHVYANGEINYTIRGIHSKVIVKWNFIAPEGTGDTHYSIMRGSLSNLVIRQGKEQNFKPVLYVEPLPGVDPESFEAAINEELPGLQAKYPGIELRKLENSWEVVVPKVYDVGHEAHFAQVTNKYLQYLVDGKLPDWEVPNMITKYYITTKALEMAKGVE